MNSEIKVVFFGIESTRNYGRIPDFSRGASFTLVGLPDKAVGEAKERIRSTFFQLEIGFPAKKVIINMALADIQKMGSQYDLPLAMAIWGSMDVIDVSALENSISIGELGLDGGLAYVSVSTSAEAA